MSQPAKVRALLATLRIANAPSVVSNVFLGFMLGWLANLASDPFRFDWGHASLACLAGVLLYFSGNLANDWFDRNWDAAKRPERALPSGLFAPGSYLLCALILASAGVALGFTLHPWGGCTALVICLFIAIYTYFHKRVIWAVIPMGLCRAGLYFLGFFAAHWDSLPGTAWTSDDLQEPAIPAIALFCYIVGLSLSARYEGMADAPKAPRIISLALLLLPIPIISGRYLMSDYPLVGIKGLIPFALWLTITLIYFRKPIPRYVSALLAGIPLVDLIAAIPQHLLLKMPADYAHTTAMVVVPVTAFILGRALQKLAPAT